MPAIVLLGHGTQEPAGAREFLAYAERLAARTGEPVAAGVLEFPTAGLPDIQTAFATAANAGRHKIVALPALLHFAGHARDDMPSQVGLARTRFPDLDITLAGPLGMDERLLKVIEERLAPFEPDEDTAVLLVGRGSTNSEANADLFKLARLLWDRNRFGWVEASFVSLAPPSVAAGIDRCRRLGARRVLVMPYFLNSGLLIKRIGDQALEAHPEAQVAQHLGVHEAIVDILLNRLEQARAGLCACAAVTGCRIPGLQCGRGVLCPA
jgi:sirohydrochlorin cobaltochelatase